MARYGTFRYGTTRYAENVLTSPDDVLGARPWDGREFGSPPVITVDSFDADGNSQTEQVTLVANRKVPYRLEVHDLDGNRISTILNWWDGFWTETANEGSVLTFSITYDDDNTQYMSRPYEIWLRDKYGAVLEVLGVRKASPEQAGDARYMHVTAESALNKLATEVVLEYERAAAAAATVGSIVADLFALQQQDAPLSVGTIDPQIANQNVEIALFQTNILAALRLIQQQLPVNLAGLFYADTKGRFQWKKRTGWQEGQTISISGALQGVLRTENWDNVFNRLYLYGEGLDPSSRLNLTDAGHATLYYDGTTQGQHGIIPAIKQDRRVRHPEALLALAQRLVSEHESPALEYQVRVINLALSDTAKGIWEELYIGSDVRIVAQDLDLDATVGIKRIRRNLGNPLDITVELANKTPRLSNLFMDIYDRLDEPFDVLQTDLYPNMARILTGDEGIDFRQGDLRFEDDDHLEVWDGDSWEDVDSPDGVTWNIDESEGNLDTNMADITGIAVEDLGDIPALGDATPEPVAVIGSATAGSSDEAAPIDHIHGVISEATPAAPTLGGATGSSGNVSDAAHAHPLTRATLRSLDAGVTYRPANAAALAAIDDAEDGDDATQQDTGVRFTRSNNAWRDITSFRGT